MQGLNDVQIIAPFFIYNLETSLGKGLYIDVLLILEYLIS